MPGPLRTVASPDVGLRLVASKDGAPGGGNSSSTMEAADGLPLVVMVAVALIS